MIISVRVKPNSKRIEVIHEADGSYLIFVKAPPLEGKANEELIQVLAKYFGRPKRNITVLRGARGRSKIIEIL